jgi:hypothetical protein
LVTRKPPKCNPGDRGIRFEAGAKKIRRVSFFKWAVLGEPILLPGRSSPEGKKWGKRIKISILIGGVIAFFPAAFAAFMSGFPHVGWKDWLSGLAFYLFIVSIVSGVILSALYFSENGRDIRNGK